MNRAVDSSLSDSATRSMSEAMRLKYQLRFFLDERDMTAAALARKSGVSKQVLSQWMSGAEPKKVSQLKAVAETLDTTVDNLCFGEGHDSQREKMNDLEALLTGDGWIGGAFEIKLRRIKRTVK